MSSELVPEADLQARARAAWQASGLTQREIAADLGVTQPSLSQALNDPQRSMTALRLRVIERCRGAVVSGPFYRLEFPDAAPSAG